MPKLSILICLSLLWILNERASFKPLQEIEAISAFLVAGTQVHCQAVFIGPDRVITAKHCFERNAKHLMVYKPDLKSYHAIEKVLPYYPPDFDRFPSFDLALIKLRKPLAKSGPWPIVGLEAASVRADLMGRFLGRANDCNIHDCPSLSPSSLDLETPIHNIRYQHLWRLTVRQGTKPCAKDSGSGIFTVVADRIHLLGLVAGVHGTLNEVSEGCGSQNFLVTELEPYRQWLDQPAALIPKADEQPTASINDWKNHCESQDIQDPVWLQTEDLLLQLTQNKSSLHHPQRIRELCELANNELLRRSGSRESVTIEPDFSLEYYARVLQPLQALKLISPSPENLRILNRFTALEHLELVGDGALGDDGPLPKLPTLKRLTLRQIAPQNLPRILAISPHLGILELDEGLCRNKAVNSLVSLNIRLHCL